MPSQNEINECIDKLRQDAKAGRYNLNPNRDDLETIVIGYMENEKKYGYPACPCRLPTGNFEEDKDIICPCDYRDDDLSEFGQCYCSLYVNDEIAQGKRAPEPIPERREINKLKSDKESNKESGMEFITGLKVNLWRCPVCGYLCAKEKPPPKCPICGAARERFELLIKKQ
jgi:ferredoxin-thioredoxin reductase catalytic subunit